MKKIYIHFSIFVLFLAIILAFSGCGRKSQENLTPALSSEEREKSPTLQKGVIEKATSSSEILETATSTEDVDTSDWKVYRNEEYGFEISYPASVLLDYSYWYCTDRKGEIIPLEIFKDTKSFYIRESYYYQEDKNNVCQKYKMSLDDIKKDSDHARWWNLQIIDNINNDKELENFLKQRYGEGCKLGEKTKINNTTYDIDILGDGKDLGETKCPINFWGTIKYSPNKKMLAIIDMGQDCRFVADRNGNGKLDLDAPNFTDCYDFDIVKTFKFLD